MRMRSRTLVAIVVAGLAVGLAGRAADHVWPTVQWASALGAPWLAVAWLVGAIAERDGRRAAAVAGALTLALGVVTYYTCFMLVEHRSSPGYVATVGTAWTLAALPCGAVAGAIGSAWRHTAWSAGALAGALLGEVLVLDPLWSAPAARRALHLEVLAGLAAVLIARRRWPAALAAGVVVALAVLVGESAVRDSLRVVGWAGS